MECLLHSFVVFGGDFEAGVLVFFVFELRADGVSDEFFATGVAEIAVVFDKGLGFVEEFGGEVNTCGEEVFDGVGVGLDSHGLGGYFT